MRIVTALLVAIAVGLSIYFYMKAEIPDNFEVTGPLKMFWLGMEKEVKPGNPAYDSFVTWIKNNKKGWHKHPSSHYITYAYDGYIEGGNFSLQYCFGRSVILWANGDFISKEIDKNDFKFLWNPNYSESLDPRVREDDKKIKKNKGVLLKQNATK